ncbi:SpaH/EbpB family LPXTG-anchored major pilin [Candidatus Enterococcus courvalinii]|uniref:SpaH/EbpB family LPXTG-anchored major pilin n=1 Tax=Candidatus Enterococcus courvalinii TaxID=2815329 RepID=A0ABS3I026_9ENTE|nr:SpaH/EbpB family LPXTG-anchored major pilin [Enterococcus sp. MSG2901]MBO0481141.1 SpaH/EbpB family LPXTG-anchored major pilin [Enterococcus sp. MSG2901]
MKLLLSRISIVLVSLLSVFMMAQIDSTEVHAETEDSSTITLHIHKLLFDYEIEVDERPNDGETNPFEEPIGLQNFEGLNDVEFTVYEVTDSYYEQLAASDFENQSIEEFRAAFLKHMQTVDTETLTKYIGITQTQGNEKGIASFELPAKKGDRDSVFFIQETNHPPTVNSLTRPMLVVLPVFDNDGNELRTIKIFPKSQAIKTVPPTLTKKINGEKADFEFGELIDYQSTLTIPSDIANYQSFVVNDQPDDSLMLVQKATAEETVSITLSQPETRPFYTFTSISERGFTVAFDPKVLADHVGEKITFSYQMLIQENNLNQSDFLNRISLIVDDEKKIEVTATVETGGKYFVKIDATDESKKLAGAEFVVLNDKGEYLSRADGKNIWIDATKVPTSYENLVKLVSDTNGLFWINGLRYGNYQLLEVKAPEGYLLNKEKVPFVVAKGTFTQQENQTLKVVNQQKEVIKSVPITPIIPTTSTKVVKPSKDFPTTADTFNNYLFIAGIILMTGAGYLLVKQHNQGVKKKNGSEENE